VWASYSTSGAAGGVPSVLDPGQPAGGPLHMVAEHLTFFTALGVVIVFVAAVAFGRLAIVGARDARLAAGEDVAWDKPSRSERAGTPPQRETPEPADDERPSVWRRLTAAR